MSCAAAAALAIEIRTTRKNALLWRDSSLRRRTGTCQGDGVTRCGNGRHGLMAKSRTLTHAQVLVAPHDGAMRLHHAGQAIDGPSRSFAAATLAMSDGATPFFIAVISASIDTAISGGLLLPM